jgi:riboflavin kinase / FMN adenylyltransferase
MKTFIVGDSNQERRPCVATIGFFDGVHRGHQYLIKQVKDVAAKLNVESTIVTFNKHPRQVLDAEFRPMLLTPFDEKVFRLSLADVDNCAVLDFDEALAQLSARDFMQKVLKGMLNVKVLILGYDNHFGHTGNESFDDYVAYGREMDIEVMRSSAFILNGVNVSSSVVRSFLSEGEVEMAAQCLSYPYTIGGHVVNGEHIGRKIGFRTANILVDDPYKMIPAGGVYGVKVRIGNTMEMKHAMLNIGVRPTFGGVSKQVIEAHIFRLDEDLYGKSIFVSLIHHIRDERKFDNPDALVEQLHADAAQVEQLFLEDIGENADDLMITTDTGMI